MTNINAVFHHCWLFLMVQSMSKWMAQAVRHTTPCTLRMVVDGPHHPSCDRKKRKHPGLMLCLDITLLICWSVLDQKPETHYYGDTSWWSNLYLRKFKSIKDSLSYIFCRGRSSGIGSVWRGDFPAHRWIWLWVKGCREQTSLAWTDWNM